MRRIAMIIVCALVATPAFAQSQSVDSALNDFRSNVLRDHIAVQGFSADPITTFRWAERGLSMEPPKLHTIGVYSLKSVKLHKEVLEISGKRYTLLQGADDQPTFVGGEPAVVRVDLHGADIAQVLPTLASMLFFPTIEAAVVAIPPEFQRLLPANVGLQTMPWPPPRPLSCPSREAKYQPPVIIQLANPEFSDQARHDRLSDEIRLVFVVDKKGHTSDPWLAKPGGHSLEEQAALAVSSYLYKPATCDGVPVNATLRVDFKITENHR